MALARLYRVIQDASGNIVPGVSTTITLSGTQTLAVLYADAGGLVGLPNPLTNDPTFGSLTCFVASGLYDLTPQKPGYSFQPQIGVSVQATETGTFQMVTSGLVSNVSVPVLYARSGRLITLNMSTAILGTSNANTFTLSGIPNNLLASVQLDIPVSVVPVTGGGGAYGWGMMRLANLSTVQVFPDAGATSNWPTTGNKGVQYFSVTYLGQN